MGGGGGSPPPPPPPPPCSSYRVSGTSEAQLRAYNCSGYRADCTSYLCTDINNKRLAFCNNYNNITRNPGGDGGNCMERSGGAEYAKEYCKVGNRIASEGVCTKDHLQNYYETLAEAYCKTASGKADAWCSCYNVINKVCDTDPAAAGCSDKRQIFDNLVDATPSEYKGSWSDMEPCFGGVCIGNKYRPGGYNTNCSKSVNICDINFDFQSMADSTINASCNISESDKGSDEPVPPSYPPGSISEKLDTIFRSRLPDSVREFVPVSVDELKTDSNKLLGLGGTGFSSVICVILLIVILFAGGAGERKGRFRR